jgi:predicted acyl esterase
LPLVCDIVLERDVAVVLRDGTTIYTDIFRPTGTGKYPSIVAWSPYGKQIGGAWLDDLPNRSGVPLAAVSELQKFEGPDPAYWVAQGYIVLNPDTRGAYASEGNVTFFGRQLAEDGYDFIEWAGTQAWSSGKVAMSGNSWLAISQWFIAAENPPHLAAIAPWEGLTDQFRALTNRGGIPSPSFTEMLISTTFAGKGFVEDAPRMSVSEPLMNDYWRDKIARLDRITVPAYVVASYTSPIHTHGTFAGFRSISSKDKWLRVHNTFEWPDYYTPQYVEELKHFFDYYLKGVVNDWPQTPRVRISVLDPGHQDTVDRPVGSWPPQEAVTKALYLRADGSLSETRPSGETSVTYNCEDESSSAGFSFTFKEVTEVIGYMNLRLWVEAIGSDDMELFVSIQKRDAKGNPLVLSGMDEAPKINPATGFLRVSHRALDSQHSTRLEPFHTHETEELLAPGQIVPIEIGLWPTAMRFHPGEQLTVIVRPAPVISTTVDRGGYGLASITVPSEGITYTPGSGVPTMQLGGTINSDPSFVNEERVPTPVSRNKGTHVFHVGNKYDAALFLPFGKLP